MPRLSIELPPPQTRFLEKQVANGRDASEVVAEALRRYEQEMAGHDADIAFHIARGDADYAADRYNTYANAQERQASMDRLVAEAHEQTKARAARR